jgi:hypothetical protein
MSLDTLLSRLTKVKRNGQGSWMACCPNHADKTASLAIKDLDDGRIIINCFAGCDTYSILNSVGLDWVDVMPEKMDDHAHKPVKQLIYPSDALRIIRFETQIVLYCAYKQRKSSLTNDDIERLELAMQRIHKAMEISNVE